MTDAALMSRAIDLAIRGRGYVEPNPCVGCVIVRDGRVVGEGFHEKVGGPHAEPNALAASSEAARGATAYVTLEPCCHDDAGKRTPPCAPRLIAAGVARVVVGCLDPNPKVSGGGVDQLREAGVGVTVGVLGDECRQLIAPFVARVVHRRPYVTLKWAVSRDGRVAGRKGRPSRITNAAATAAVHALRGRCDAIAVGTNTLVNDDPLLTARTPGPPRRPVRVVLSNSLRFPAERRLFLTPGDGPVLVFTTDERSLKPRADSPQVRASGRSSPTCGLSARGFGGHLPDHVEIVRLPARDDGRGGRRFSVDDAYAELVRRDGTHLLIEPGPTLARGLIGRGQADRAWVFYGQNDVGDDGLPAPACDWPIGGELDLDGDRLVERLNPESATYAALTPSPDLRLSSSE